MGFCPSCREEKLLFHLCSFLLILLFSALLHLQNIYIFCYYYFCRMKRGRKTNEANSSSSEETTEKEFKRHKVIDEKTVVTQSPDWANLLQDIILQVFQYLPLLDRAHASQVCRSWNQVFHMPDLWRCFEFELNQPATSYLRATHPELIKQIIKRHSNHLQYVSFKVVYFGGFLKVIL